MKILKVTKQQFQELVDTYDTSVEGLEWFLNIDTGDIVMLREYDRDEEDQEWSEIV